MKRSKGMVMLLALILCLVSACSIVRPEYLAESALIPKQSPAIDAEATPFLSTITINPTPVSI